MLLTVPHYVQSHRKTCVPTCVRMVLEFQGVTLGESELARVLQSEEEGTRLNNVELLQSLPLIESITLARLNLEQMEASLTDGFPVIVYLWTGYLSYWRVATVHSVVVVGFDDAEIFVNDPFFNEAPRGVPRAQLTEAWTEVDNWAAIVRCRRGGS